MSSPSELVTAELLRQWGLPAPGDSKKTRGRVMVVGGSRRSPGAVVLAGEAALRVGAGRLGLVVPASVEGQLGVVIPEAAVLSLPQHASDPIAEPAHGELEAADAVLLGPGFDNGDETKATLLAVGDVGVRCLVLDAYALGVLADVPRERLPRDLILNPNQEEAELLLGRELGEDRESDLREIARRFDAVVNCYGVIADPHGATWQVPAGGPGLGTSGSGDVLAGAITGFAARGVDPSRAAVWGSWVHARAGDALTERLGIGFLARDLPAALTASLNEVTA
ncbi:MULTISPECIES: NAD(P)H-hydrate dehydratase [unclassified Microbacterium]|uniref:NAD(P)H-hydrate dehydratase n=1 Tax=unclassified Microbacterium TaxID=2609290 RepID=UPI00214CF9A0|nr:MULTISPECIES: NAD(P)H-hydrate dehydratase [unclassified Microbacterium]MCR2810992.1 NAD(P)H-hydrate dehydratase [Microbacterium sp. zg.B185]WIM19610.1 NAD(P)H-hydrate dehydratase [Microbacterium sp. zg-B185]